jgi:hypothetical protein
LEIGLEANGSWLLGIKFIEDFLAEVWFFWCGNWVLDIALIEDFLMVLDYELNPI